MRTEPREGFRVLVGFLVAAAAFLAYLPVLSNGFVNWDDHAILLRNPHWQDLGLAQLRWMFTSFHLTAYHPLGWLAYALIHALQGLRPFGFHLGSVLLHALNAAVLYGVSYGLLGRALPGRSPMGRILASAFAALFWALHPLQVETVALATALPNILATSFFLAALLAYLRAADAPSPSACHRALAAVWILFLFSAFSRWYGASLPLVLIVLDLYPLGRLPPDPRRWLDAKIRGVWLEKIPLALTALALVAATAWGKSGVGYRAVARPHEACVGVLFYLWKMLKPVGLIPLYTLHGRDNPLGLSLVSGALAVLVLTAALILLRRRFPAGLAAWVCYLAGVAPSLALAQEGPMFVSDHYVYLAGLGFPILLGGALLRCWQRRFQVAPTFVVAALALAVLGRLTWKQCGVWHNSVRLWTHTLSLDPKSYVARPNLAAALLDENFADESEALLREHLLVHPQDELAKLSLAQVSALAEKLKPRNARGHNDRAVQLFQESSIPEAEREFAKALELDPRLAEAQNNLGLSLYRRGLIAEARARFEAALRIDPRSVEAHNNLGIALIRQGALDQAVRHFRRALDIDPNHLRARENLRMALELKKSLSVGAR